MIYVSGRRLHAMDQYRRAENIMLKSLIWCGTIRQMLSQYLCAGALILERPCAAADVFERRHGKIAPCSSGGSYELHLS